MLGPIAAHSKKLSLGYSARRIQTEVYRFSRDSSGEIDLVPERHTFSISVCKNNSTPYRIHRIYTNIVTDPHSAAVAVIRNGGPSWAFTGGGQTSLAQASALPLLPGNNWGTSVKDPVTVPHTQTMIVAVFMRNTSSSIYAAVQPVTQEIQSEGVRPGQLPIRPRSQSRIRRR